MDAFPSPVYKSGAGVISAAAAAGINVIKEVGEVKSIKVMLLFTIILLLTGCYDKTELEKRGFIGAFSVDLTDGEIQLGAELLSLPEEKQDKNESPDENGRDIKRVTRANLSEAIRGINEESSKALSFWLSKTCLLGEELLMDENRLREAINSLEKNNEISVKLIILAVRGEGADTLKKEVKGENALGYYIANYYKHAKNKATSALLIELETLAGALREGSGVLIPVYSCNEENVPEFSGAAMVKGELLGYASDDELKGIAWAKGLGRGRALTAKTDDNSATFMITGQSVRYGFHEEDGGVVCTMRVKAEGELMDFTPDMQISKLEGLFADAIIDEIKDTHAFLSGYGIDGYRLKERLYKRFPSLLEKYGDFERYSINAEVFITINN